MTTPVFRVDDILQKMEQRDPDFRFMAVSDLYNECNKDSFKLDANQEKKICAKLLQMVTDDASVEVKTLCNKWYVSHSCSLMIKPCAFVCQDLGR